MLAEAGAAAADYELVVIGGGINGAGIARDAGLRGIRTLLLEANDFGSGTSSWSTRLIHGGLRYLEYGEIPLVRESLHERRRLLSQAPHLVRPLCLSIPIYEGAKRGRWIVRLGMLAYDVLSFGKSLPPHRMLDSDEMLKAVPGLCKRGLRGGAQYYDGQVTFAERLVLENVLDARSCGVETQNYATVTGIARSDSRRFEVRFRHRGEDRAATAAVVVNAAGPWVDDVLAATGMRLPRLMGGTKGSHIVVDPFECAPAQALYVEAKSDGRPIFIIPWNGQYLIGTTDIRVEGDPGDARASDEEIAYLIDETNRVLPGAGLVVDDINFTYSGVRPLPFQQEGPESAITRRHIIFAHDGDADGLISIIGGKLTTYRSLAEQATDAVARKLGRSLPGSATREAALPGGRDFDPEQPLPAPLADALPAGRDRLLAIYGARVAELAELCRAEPALCRAVDSAGRVLAAEVVFAMRDEQAESLVDIVYRRSMIGLSARVDRAVVDEFLALAAAEAGWDAGEIGRQREALARHHERLRRRR